jgi:hypothetical protein
MGQMRTFIGTAAHCSGANVNAQRRGHTADASFDFLSRPERAFHCLSIVDRCGGGGDAGNGSPDGVLLCRHRGAGAVSTSTAEHSRTGPDRGRRPRRPDRRDYTTVSRQVARLESLGLIEMPCRRRDRRISEATVPAHQFLDIVVVPRLMRKFADAMSCKCAAMRRRWALGKHSTDGFRSALCRINSHAARALHRAALEANCHSSPQ